MAVEVEVARDGVPRLVRDRAAHGGALERGVADEQVLEAGDDGRALGRRDVEELERVVAQRVAAGRALELVDAVARAVLEVLAVQERAVGQARAQEVPVLGSRPEALAGTLQLMVGGEAAALERARPVLAALGGEPRLLGPVGAALTTKLALNQLIASLTHSFSLSLHLVQRAGVDVEAFMAILRASALHAPTFDKKLAKELADDYANPNFPTAHLRKDLQLFLQAAAAADLNSEGLSGLAQLLERATAAGIDDLDYSALHRLTGAPRPVR